MRNIMIVALFLTLGCAAAPVQVEVVNNPQQEQLQIEQQWVAKLQYIHKNLQPMERSLVYTLEVKNLWAQGVTLQQLMQKGHFYPNSQKPHLII